MKFFGLELKKQKDLRDNFTDEGRTLSAEIRRMKGEQRKLETETLILKQKMKTEEAKADLEDLKEELYGVDDEEDDQDNSIDKMFMSLIMNKLQNQSMNPRTEETILSEPPILQGVSLTDTEIKTQLNVIPKSYRKKLKTFSNEHLSKLIISYMPNLSKETVERSVTMFKSL